MNGRKQRNYISLPLHANSMDIQRILCCSPTYQTPGTSLRFITTGILQSVMNHFLVSRHQ